MNARNLLDLSRKQFADTLAAALAACGLRLPMLQQVIRREAFNAFDELAELRNKEDFQRKRGVTASRISLVNADDMDLTVSLINLSHALSDACERDLPRLQLLFMRLLDQSSAVMDQLPVGPEAVSIALRGVCDSGEVPSELRPRLPALAQPHLIEALRVFYPELTRLLGEHGVEPASLLRSVQASNTRSYGGYDLPGMPVAGVPGVAGGYAIGQAPALNTARLPDTPLGRLQERLLQRHPAQGAGPALDPELLKAIVERVLIWLTERQTGPKADESPNLGELRSVLPSGSHVALEAIGMAFDALGADRRLCAPVRASIARLRLPVCKAALIDATFLDKSDGPTRRFLEVLLRLAYSLPPGETEAHPVARIIDGATRDIQRNFERDLSIFGRCSESLLSLERRLLTTHAQYTAELTPPAQHEMQREQSRHRAARAIKALCAGVNVPRPIRVFLDQLWVRVMSTLYQHGGGEKSPAWLRALHTANQLVESVQVRADAPPRDVLIARLPPLLAELRAGLDAIGTPEALREKAFRSFVGVHTAALNGRMPDFWPQEDFMSPSPPRLDPLKAQPGAFVLRLPPAAEPDHALPEWILQIEAGQWIDLDVPGHGWRRLRIGWAEGMPRMLLGISLDGDFKLIFPARSLDASGDSAARRIPMTALFEQAAEAAGKRVAG